MEIDIVGFVNSPAFLWTVILLELVIIFWLIFGRGGNQPGSPRQP